VRVSNAGATQSGSEQFTTELRVVARSGNCAYVDETVDAMGGEQTDDLADGSCGVANRKDSEWRRITWAVMSRSSVTS
jgi:hypothetical protein